MVGRKSKLTKELIEIVKEYLKTGVFIKIICQFIGINRDTFYSWLKQGDKDKKENKITLYSEFSDTYKHNKDYALIFHLENIQKIASKSNLQASIFYLKTRYPQYFSDNPELRKQKKPKIKSVESDVNDILQKLNDKLSD